MRYDITFSNPLGNMGIHYAVEAESESEAIAISPSLLSASSQWKAEQFTILSVKESEHKSGN